MGSGKLIQRIFLNIYMIFWISFQFLVTNSLRDIFALREYNTGLKNDTVLF